jgi:toxin FitB
MIILDTNVLSETLKPSPNEIVLEWMANLPASDLFTTSVTEAEIRYGVTRLPEGQRKANLKSVINDIFTFDFSGRILPFDSAAALAFAHLTADRERMGRPISQFDAQIAAIARTCGAALATRNIDDFEACGLHLINPWTA